MTEPTRQQYSVARLTIEDDALVDKLLARVDFRQWLMAEGLDDTRIATLGVAIRELHKKWNAIQACKESVDAGLASLAPRKDGK